VQTNNPDDLQCARAEDPQYVKENNLPLDALYYLQRSLMSPVCSLFELFVDNPEENLFGDLIRQLKPPKVVCVGVTQKGTPCSNRPLKGSSACKIHQRQVT
jgi:hypothetical protein